MPNDLPMLQDPLNFEVNKNNHKVDFDSQSEFLLESRKDLLDTKNKEDLLLLSDKYLTAPLLDFTKYEYITAIITDLGIKTPSAISEELMNMWYD